MGDTRVSGFPPHLVEVDIHPFQLKIGRPIVAAMRQAHSTDPCLTFFTHTPEPSRPCSPDMFCLYGEVGKCQRSLGGVRSRVNIPKGSTNLVTLSCHQ